MRCYRLLIVDDDLVDRQLYGRLLMQSGPEAHQSQQVIDGTAGLAALRAQPFDCVLLDFNLPDMTGFEFLTAAAVDGELPCAVVLITGQGNEAIAVEAMKRGVQDYLVKDQVNAANLWRSVTLAVTRRELQQRLAQSLCDLKAANLALAQEAAIRATAEADMRAAKDAAEQANHAKTHFVAMVTHELRTPLNSILGYAQLLRLEAGLSNRQDAHVGAMMQAGRHLVEMIERVLDFASIEAGRMELHPVDLSVRELTEGCIAFIAPMATERTLGLRIIIAHDAPRRIIADPARLRQVLLNLLGNAVKYTDAGSIELRLLAGAAPGALRIEVADTGRGISKASRDRLFQDFERLEAAPSVEGTGLGLAIAARTVGLMGGTIAHAAHPTAANPDGGSVFWFELPAATSVPPPLTGGNLASLVVGDPGRSASVASVNADANPPAVAESAQDNHEPDVLVQQFAIVDEPPIQPSSSLFSAACFASASAAQQDELSQRDTESFSATLANTLKPMLLAPVHGIAASAAVRLLVVDDVAMNRDIISAFLLAAGYATVLAESGKRAVELAFEQAFDLILMDVRMPGMDGLEAARRIRALPLPYGQVPILALTANTFPTQIEECRAAGMDGHVAKPVDYETLIRAVAEVIAIAQSGHESNPASNDTHRSLDHAQPRNSDQPQTTMD